MPCATLEVSSFQRALTSPLGKNLLTNAQARLVLGNQLHPPPVPANDMQLPSAIGSPASYCPVPVVQGHNNHLPVKHTYFTLLLCSLMVLLKLTFAFSWLIRKSLEKFKSTLAASVMVYFAQFYVFLSDGFLFESVATSITSVCCL